MRNQYHIRRLWLRRIVKIHASLVAIFLGVYFLFAFLDPGLLSYDLRQKFHALADETITVTATVLGPPVQPVVTAAAECNNTTGVLSVALDWADDPNTYTYDIDRDSSPLVSGLSSSAYRDTNVVVSTTYEYQVTANGPMGPGSATSDPVSVTTPDECEVTAAAPAVTIVSFAGKNVDAYDDTPRVSTRRPLFTGTTSMPNAVMTVVLGGDFIAEFSANSNGYWEWRPPYNISSGRHTFTITAVDPEDDARRATATLRFDILKDDDDSEESTKSKGSAAQTGGETGAGVGTGEGSETASPLLFSLALAGNEASVLQGRELELIITIKSLLERYTHITIPVRYSLTDKDYNIIFSELRQSYVTENAEIRESFTIPDYISPGQYFFQVEMLLDNLSISRMIPVSVIEMPLIELPSGKALTYADIIHNLGWLVMGASVAFLIWLSLLIREFALSLKGGKTITEYDLRKHGFIRK